MLRCAGCGSSAQNPFLLSKLLLLLLLCIAPVIGEEDSNVVHLRTFPEAEVLMPASNASVGGVRTEMTICECEKATGSPNGLSCEKEGWFISSFEREGSWLSGGGLVPLSHAMCCRPCLPAELPETQAPISSQDKAVAVMSIGCHATTGSGPFSLKCEQQGNSVVSGWAQAVLVSSSIDAYYPLGAASCCTPSLLLESGDAWEFERCSCIESNDINCGGTSTHRLLFGFDRWRITRNGQFVPIGPAQCCKMCLSDTVHPIDACDDLHFCSGHGMCTLGACQCLPGWAGADCSIPGSGGGGGLPQWLVSVIIMSSCAALSLLMLIVNRVIRYFQLRSADDEGSEDGEQLREPLSLHLGDDDDGSVGSEDTTDYCDSELEDGQHRSRSRSRSRSRRGDGVPDLEAGEGPGPGTAAAALEVTEPSGQHSTSPATAFTFSHGSLVAEDVRSSAAHPPAGPSSAVMQAQQEDSGLPMADSHVSAEAQPRSATEFDAHSAEPATAATRAEELLDLPGVGDADGDDVMVELLDKEGMPLEGRGQKREGCPGVPGRDCNVCMVRAVQVALIPCGHACMCRRCSRRLSRCPVCRKEILRRQRLYI